MTRKPDYKALAESLLAQADTLVPQWLPGGRREGHEYKALNPLRADSKVGSFSVNLTSGQWADFAVEEKGGDLLSLYAYLFHGGKQGMAYKDLTGGEVERPAQAAKTKDSSTRKTEKEEWTVVMPVPDDAPYPPAAHIKRGKPENIWVYRDAQCRVLGYIYRFTTSDCGKEILPLTYCKNAAGKGEWRWKVFADKNRPLYGLDRLAAKPDASVIVVEGEKCADALQAKCPDRVVVTWSGGAGAVDKTDFSPLFGRNVCTWADADSKRVALTLAEKDTGVLPESKPYLPAHMQPGYKAMVAVRQKLAGQCNIYDMPLQQPGTLFDGYDCADLIKQNPDLDMTAYIRQHAQKWKGEPVAKPARLENVHGLRGQTLEKWQLKLREKKTMCYQDLLGNMREIFTKHPAWEGVLAFDEFANKIVKLKAPPYDKGKTGEWDAEDTRQATMWLTDNGLLQASTLKVDEAIETAARDNAIHPVREWLNALQWDGIKRLETWPIECLGAEYKPHVLIIGKLFILGMVYRVFEPGCKFDFMLVLEGAQGIGKSTAMRVLAGDYFSDTPLDLNNVKDSASGIQGIWLHEFAELHSLQKAEATRIKNFLASQEDKYRPPYGRRDVTVKRQCVFGGTTNERQFNKDKTGGRRYWPIHCVEALNIPALRQMRDQLFAEAVALYKEKTPCYPTREQEASIMVDEQQKIETPDPYVELLFNWVNVQILPFTVTTAIMEGLKTHAEKITPVLTHAVGSALTKLGCGWEEKRHSDIRCYRTPPVNVDARLLSNWAYAQSAPFTMSQAITEGLKMSSDKINRDLTDKVEKELTKLGCFIAKKRDGDIRCYFNPPVKNPGENANQTRKESHNDSPF